MRRHSLWTIASKEIVDHVRDGRSLIAALMYTLMGPAVVFLVALGGPGKGDAARTILPGMLSVFALVAAFAGGMNVAMDLIAGERERRSLLPLLLNAVDRRDVLAGKWLAACSFALAGFVLNLAASWAVLARAGMGDPGGAVTIASGIVSLAPLPLFAAALQLLLSTVCRSVKEAQTYLSMAVFLPMGLGMLGVFFPAAQGWGRYVPMLGQQLLIDAAMRSASVDALAAAASGCFTLGLAALALGLAAGRLGRDEIVYAG